MPVKIPRRAIFQRVDARQQRAQGGHPNESNDCTVRALATAAGMRYEDAHVIMQLSGRRALRGHSPMQGLEVGVQLGMLNFEKISLRAKYPDADTVGQDAGLFTEEELKDKRARFVPRTASGIGGYWMRGHWTYTNQPKKRVTLSMVLKKLPKGRFILATNTHAFAVIDGVVYDSRPQALSCSIVLCYRIVTEAI